MSRQNSRNVQFSDVCDVKTAIILIKFLTNQNSPIISPKSIKFSSVTHKLQTSGATKISLLLLNCATFQRWNVSARRCLKKGFKLAQHKQFSARVFLPKSIVTVFAVFSALSQVWFHERLQAPFKTIKPLYCPAVFLH